MNNKCLFAKWLYHLASIATPILLQPFFYTPYSSDLFTFAKLRIVIRFISSGI